MISQSFAFFMHCACPCHAARGVSWDVEVKTFNPHVRGGIIGLFKLKHKRNVFTGSISNNEK